MATIGENNFRYFKNVNRLFRGSDYDYNLDQLLGIFNGKDGTVYDVQFGNINASSLIASIIGDSSSTIRGDGSQLTGISAAVANISPTSYPDLFIMNALEKAGIIASAPNAIKINNAFMDTSKMTGSVRVSYTTAAGTSILFDHGLDSELEEINDMQTKADWTAGTGTPTIADDSTNFLKGTLSIKMSKTVTGGLDMYDTVDLSLADRNLRVSAFPDTLSSVSYLYVILYTSSGNTVEYRFPASGLTAAEWNHLTVDLNSAPDASAGTFVRGTITRIYLGAFTSASQPINVSWATVTAISDKPFLVPGYSQSIVIKDGTNQEVTTVVSEDSGLPGKFTLSAALDDNYSADAGVLTANSGTVSNGQMTHDATGTGVQATKAIKIDTLQTSKTISSASLEAFIRFYHPSIELNTFTSTTQFGAYSATNVSAFYTAGTPVIIYKSLRVNGKNQSMNGTASSNFFYTTLASNSTYSGTTLSFETTDAIDLSSDTTGYYLIPATVVYKYCAGAKTANTFKTLLPSKFLVKTDEIPYTSVPYIHSHWKLNELSGNAINAKQDSGVYDLTMVGIVPSTTGKFGNARGPFTDSNYFKWAASGSSSTIYDTSVFAIEFWFKYTVSGRAMYFIAKGDIFGTGWVIFHENSDNKMRFYTQGDTINTAATHNDGNWHHIWAGIKSGAINDKRIYIDGSLSVQGTDAAWAPSTEDFCVGRDINAASLHYDGLIDSIVYWATVPSTWAEIEAIIAQRYAGGRGREYGNDAGFTSVYTDTGLSNINKLETAIEINRNDTTNQNPEVYETGTWLY